MPRIDASALRHQLRHLGGPAEEPSDSGLLGRYLQTNDEPAFAELVRRHGPLVLAVCRSVLADAHAAEDAFQATFLVLARRAASIRRRESVASWLHGVALRLAHKARAQAARRMTHEHEAPPRSAAADDLSGRELREILHQELDRLPGQYRAPLVLCYLEGLTQDEAARHLGLSAATLKGRLTRGRALLRRRLVRRGLTLTTLLSLSLLAPGPAPAALSFAVERVSPAARALAESSAGLVWAAWVKLLAVAVLLACVAVGLGAWMLGAGGMQPPILPVREAPTKVAAGPGAKAPLDLHGDPLPAGAVARLGTLRFHHPARPSHLCASPDGRLLATAGQDGNVCLWDVAGGKLLGRLEGHERDLSWIAFAPDGKRLATSDGRAVRGWDLARRRLAWEQAAVGGPCALAFTADGQALTAVNAAGVRRFDAATGTPQAGGPRGGLPRLYGVAFSPRSERLVTATTLEAEPGVKQPLRAVFKLRYENGDTLRRLGEADAPERMIGGFPHYPQLTALSPDGKLFAAASHWSSHLLRLYDVATGKELRKLWTNPGVFTAVSFAPAGGGLATADTQGWLRLWDAASATERWCVRAHYREVRSLAFLPGGEELASVAADGVVRVWDAATGREIHPRAGAEAPLEALAVAPDGRAVFAAGDPTIRRWDPATGRLLGRLGGVHVHAVRGLACSADGKMLASTGNDYLVALWDVPAGKCRRWWQGEVYAGKCVAIAPDGKTVATGHEDGTWVLWDATTGAGRQRARPHKWRINSIAFSPDGKFLASSAADPVVHLVELGAGRSRWTPGFAAGEVRSLAFSPDGKTLAAGTDGTEVFICDAANGDHPRKLEAAAHHGLAVAFSPDGRLLATGGRGGVIYLWDTSSWESRGVLRGHEGAVTALAFLPDGKRLVSASADTTALVWDVANAGRPKAIPEK
jgi:RNA polymerase sigma factor (sigma-70 family)